MVSIAAKHTDPIVGLDMHLIQPPPPAPPVMVPHPVAGMVMDPADYGPGACTVYVNGLPRARAGNLCMMTPPHVPIGGMFVKPPLSEAELYQGSSTVTADGEAMSAMSHQVLGCHDIGALAPVRKWKSGGAKSLMKAGSIVVAIPGGLPVLVGGSPTTAASSSSTETETDFFSMEVIGHDGRSLAGASYRLRFDDGAERAGALDETGRVWLGGVPKGTVRVVVSQGTSRIDGRRIHTMVRGEPIERVAWSHGFESYLDVWNAQQNEALRRGRHDAHSLLHGDALFIPDPFVGRPALETGGHHVVEVRVPTITFKLRLLTTGDRPIASTRVILSHAETMNLATDDNGYVEASLAVTTTHVRVRVESEDAPAEYEFVLGALEPTDDPCSGAPCWSGIAQRLHAIGCGVHVWGEASSERAVRRSLARFQRTRLGRENPDGAPDEETLRELRKSYGEGR